MPRKEETKNEKNERSDRSGESGRKSRQVQKPLHDVFNRFFDESTWSSPGDFFRRDLPRGLARFGIAAFPRIDIEEGEETVTVLAEVPGADPDDIDVTIRGDRMILSGRTVREHAEGSDDMTKPYRYERVAGEWRREFTLPARVRDADAKATYKDGVLKITVPKAEDEIKKKIRIEREE